MDGYFALIRAHCEGCAHIHTLGDLKAWIAEQIDQRKYADDLRRARSLIEEYEAGWKNVHVFGEVFMRLYCATHSGAAWHHDWDAADRLLWAAANA